jgi:hypothetical protein
VRATIRANSTATLQASVPAESRQRPYESERPPGRPAPAANLVRLTGFAGRSTIELALEFALNRPTGEDDSYQGCSLAGFPSSDPNPRFENPYVIFARCLR